MINSLSFSLTTQATQGSIDSLQRALSAASSDNMRIDLHANLAVTAHSQGKFEEAEISYHQALALDPTSHACWANLASLLLRSPGRAKEATAAVLRAISLGGEKTEYLKIRAEISS